MSPAGLIPPGVRALFFDAVGTLLYPDPPAPLIYLQVAQRFGSARDVATISLRFRAAFRRQEEWDWANGLRTDEEREVTRWRTIVREVLDDVTDVEACFQILYEHFAQPQSWRCDGEAETVLRKLAEQGYVLGVASNFDHRLHDVLAGRPALAALRHRLISSEVGWRKPAPEFFREMGQHTGLSSSQIILVGDDLVNDYQGAQAAGLHALLLALQPPAGVPAAHCMPHLRDLLDRV
jgi:putative hydrolase of the HAD superfamily